MRASTRCLSSSNFFLLQLIFHPPICLFHNAPLQHRLNATHFAHSVQNIFAFLCCFPISFPFCELHSYGPPFYYLRFTGTCSYPFSSDNVLICPIYSHIPALCTFASDDVKLCATNFHFILNRMSIYYYVVKLRDFEIVLTTETWLHDSVVDYATSFNEYNLLRDSRFTAHIGGVCISIKSSVILCS